MNEALRTDKGLGNAEVYSRIPFGGQSWSFTAGAWVGTEVSGCRAFMTEFGDTSTTQAWYYTTFTPPAGGPYPVEIVRLSTGEVIGNDVTWGIALTGPGTVSCLDILTVVARQLQDVSNITWPLPVLLPYLNLAVKAIIDIKPEANPITENIALGSGTRQSLPAGRKFLMNAKRNMGADGATPGRTITPIDREMMDSVLPDWHSFPADTSVRHVISDDRDPYSFDVFPPQPIGTAQKIEAVMSAYPAKATDASTDPFPLPDEYEAPAIDYIIHMALYESTTIPNAINKSNASLAKFNQGLGIQIQAERKVYAEGQ